MRTRYDFAAAPYITHFVHNIQISNWKEGDGMENKALI